jgi:hypothetical protein
MRKQMQGCPTHVPLAAFYAKRSPKSVDSIVSVPINVPEVSKGASGNKFREVQAMARFRSIASLGLCAGPIRLNPTPDMSLRRNN